jgi:hypothetical protein
LRLKIAFRRLGSGVVSSVLPAPATPRSLATK